MTHRTKLLCLLAVQLVLTIIHVLLRTEEEFWSWHYLAGLCFGIVVMAYAFSIRCPVHTCGSRQVFRGWSAFDVRLPGEHCYNCGASLR
jgi:hypothetical protein